MVLRPLNLSCAFSQFAFLLLAGALAPRATAQCATTWLPGEGLPGTSHQVNATTLLDPDAGGPMQPVLVVGGHFTVAGTVQANRIAVYDPVSGVWSTLGTGMLGAATSGGATSVHALTAMPNGDLVAGGEFTTAGGVPARNVARWNGTNWSPLGTGVNGKVYALTTLPNGDVVAGGEFDSAGGVSANYVARWDGSTWSVLGSGMSGSYLPGESVRALTTLPNGDVVAGGNFDTAGGVSARRIARWNGVSWSALGAGMNPFSWGVTSLTKLPNGDLVAGGSFSTAGSVAANNIARWNGTNWSPLGSGLPGSSQTVVAAVTTLPNGDLVAGGAFNLARWNGTSWSPLDPSGLFGNVYALTTLPNGDLVAGGWFWDARSTKPSNIARWSGAGWLALGTGLNGNVHAVTTLPNGDLVAGGFFALAGGVPARNIARRSGTTWSALGSGISGSSWLAPVVYALTTLPNGDLVAGGSFDNAGGVSAINIARWDGTSWSALGTRLNDSVSALTTLANGDLVAGGGFTTAGGASANCIARWDGTSWSALGTGLNGGVRALTTLPNGDLVAGGGFTTAGGASANCIARWDGSNWSALGSGISDGPWPAPFVHALATLPNGDLVAGGLFKTAGGVSTNRIALWNGTNWSALGSGMDETVLALTLLPNRDLVAGGWFTRAGGVRANYIARWNGTKWSVLGEGTNGSVRAQTTLPNGDLVAAGGFLVAGSGVSAFLAQLTTTCPAIAVSSGSGCTGSGGPNVLTATSLPWTGSTLRSVATGMPNNALAIGVRGLSTTSIPLASILPQGVAGCSLLVSPFLLDLLVPTAGSVQTQFAIPNTVVLAGQIFHQQVVPVELDVQGNIVALTSTNRLTLTIGSF